MAGRRDLVVLFPSFVQYEFSGRVRARIYYCRLPLTYLSTGCRLADRTKRKSARPADKIFNLHSSTQSSHTLVGTAMDERTSLLSSGKKDGDHGAAQNRSRRSGRSSRFGGRWKCFEHIVSWISMSFVILELFTDPSFIY